MDHRHIAECLLFDADQYIPGTTPSPPWESILAHSILALCDRLEDFPPIVIAEECEEDEDDDE